MAQPPPDDDLFAVAAAAIDAHADDGLRAQLEEIEEARAACHRNLENAAPGQTATSTRTGRTMSISEAHRECDDHFDGERDRITASWEAQRVINHRNMRGAVADLINSRSESTEHVMHDASLSSEPPILGRGEYDVDSERGHSTQVYPDNSRVSWDNTPDGEKNQHWTDQDAPKGAPDRNKPPPHAK